MTFESNESTPFLQDDEFEQNEENKLIPTFKSGGNGGTTLYSTSSNFASLSQEPFLRHSQEPFLRHSQEPFLRHSQEEIPEDLESFLGAEGHVNRFHIESILMEAKNLFQLTAPVIGSYLISYLK
jgi:hypothetical protein